MMAYSLLFPLFLASRYAQMLMRIFSTFASKIKRIGKSMKKPGSACPILIKKITCNSKQGGHREGIEG